MFNGLWGRQGVDDVRGRSNGYNLSIEWDQGRGRGGG